MGNQVIETPSLNLQESKDLHIQRCLSATCSTSHTPDSEEPTISTTDNKEAKVKGAHQAVPGCTHTPSEQDFEALKPYFAWIPTKTLNKNSFANSTQCGYILTYEEGNIFKRWKSPQPGMNVFRFNNDLLMDEIFSDVPAIDGGFKSAMLFFGRKSHIIHIEH